MKTCQEFPAYQRLPRPVVSAQGVELVLAGGRPVLDLYGGHCVNTLGAGDPGVAAAMSQQWSKVSFATNLFDHEARVAYLEEFGELSSGGPWQVFFSNSGAEANENALKGALAATGRETVVAFEGAFHGRTAAAAAASDGSARPFPRAPFDLRRLPFGDADALAAIDDAVGAVIVEPIQSLAGVRVAPEGWLAALRARCDAAGAVLVLDEVQTGNGRLGTPWGWQHFGVEPDVFTTAKGAASGLPIGITALRAQLAERLPGSLFGSTFGGGPTVLAAAAEVARRLRAPGFLENVRATSAALREAALSGPVRAVRGVGLLLGLELAEGVDGKAVRAGLLENGVLVGGSDDPRVLRLLPPLTLRPEHAARLRDALLALPDSVLDRSAQDRPAEEVTA